MNLSLLLHILTSHFPRWKYNNDRPTTFLCSLATCTSCKLREPSSTRLQHHLDRRLRHFDPSTSHRLQPQPQLQHLLKLHLARRLRLTMSKTKLLTTKNFLYIEVACHSVGGVGCVEAFSFWQKKICHWWLSIRCASIRCANMYKTLFFVFFCKHC